MDSNDCLGITMMMQYCATPPSFHDRYDVRVPSPMAHLVALHGCRILANMACDGETGDRRVTCYVVLTVATTAFVSDLICLFAGFSADSVNSSNFSATSVLMNIRNCTSLPGWSL